MARIVDIRNSDEPRDVIHQAVELLSAGNLVALPTETEYVVAAHAASIDGVCKLRGLLREPDQTTFKVVLAIKGAQEANDFVPDMSPLGLKLSRRCWPGPVTLRFPASRDSGLLGSLPEETCAIVVSGGEISLRAPAHDAILETLRLLPSPLVLSPESHSNSILETADAVNSRYGEEIAMILDDGACRYGEPSTIVKVTNDQWDVVLSGVVNDTMLSRLASEFFLFVCTGNTCRSPMAEGLFRKFLAERVQCTEDELFDRGYVVESAGLAAAIGAPASPESVEVVQQLGIDLRAHSSQPLTDRLLEQADYVYTMTRSHRDSILAVRPDVSDRVRLLSRDGSDVPDPIGGSMGDYQNCEQTIERNVRAILDEIEFKD